MYIQSKPGTYFKYPGFWGALLTMCCICFSTLSQADSHIHVPEWYGGFVLADSKQETEFDDGTEFDVSRTNIRGKFGRIFSDFLAVEGQVGAMSQSGISKDPIFTAGIYARLSHKFENLGAYVLLGVGNVQTYDNESGGSEVSQSGASFGVGLELFGSASGAITLEILRLVNSSETDVDSTGIGYNFYF